MIPFIVALLAIAVSAQATPASQTQVVFIHAEPASDGSAAIEVSWKSQREINLIGYDLYRADDVGGAPGAFVQVNTSTISGIGQEQIEGVDNRNLYTFVDPGVSFDNTYWYRLEHTSSDPDVGTVQEPALRVTLGQPRVVATVSYSITHNAFANDLLVLFGTGPQTERPKAVFDGASPEDADSVTTEPGEATTGTTRYEFSVDLFATDLVDGFLPPSKENPWFLLVNEGGFINRSGRVNSFAITTFDADGNVVDTFATPSTSSTAPAPSTSTASKSPRRASRRPTLRRPSAVR